MFTESKERLGGQDLDIFVVNRCFPTWSLWPVLLARCVSGCTTSWHVSDIHSLHDISAPSCWRIAQSLLMTLTNGYVSCCSFASGFQALSVALMLPGIASLRGIGWQNLPGYLVEGVLQAPTSHPSQKAMLCNCSNPHGTSPGCMSSIAPPCSCPQCPQLSSPS